MTKPLSILQQHLKPGQMVYTIRRSRARSGQSVTVSVVVLTGSGPWDITGMVARVLGERRQKDGSIRVQGGGVDPGFHLVYNLSTVLFPAGFNCTGRANCPSNEHENGDRLFSDHIHKDGGYALRHQWI
jgi:hypothetical protein